MSSVQGTGEASAWEGLQVSVLGIVTTPYAPGDAALGALPGFYLQAPEPDEDEDTSEGLFIYGAALGDAVRPGQRVKVSGVIHEYFGETQLEAETIAGCGEGELPTAAPLALPALAVQAGPSGGWLPRLEPWEGMRVRVSEVLRVADLAQLGRFGEILLCAGPLPSPFTQRHPPDAAAFEEYRRERAKHCIVLDDPSVWENVSPIAYPYPAFNAQNTVRRGDRVAGAVGVLRFGTASGEQGAAAFRLLPSEPPMFDRDAAAATPPDVHAKLRIAALNLQNYFQHTTDSGACYPGFEAANCRGADNPVELERQEAKLLTLLTRLDADAYAVTEVENDAGAAQPSSLARLTAVLNHAALTRCGAYEAVDLGAPLGGDAIAVGLILCRDTLAVAPGTGPALLTDAWLSQQGEPPSPGVFSGVSTNRSPLAVSVVERASGETFTVVVNHLKSKGASGLDLPGSPCLVDPTSDPNCDQADGQGHWNQRRRQAIAALADWLGSFPTGSRDPDVLLVGDFNAYAEEQPLADLRRLGFSSALQSSTDYSYVFSGEAGSLDHVFASASMEAQLTAVATWHVNADEAALLDYNLDFGRASTLFDGETPSRASDHDPVVVGINLTAGCACDAPGAIVGTQAADILVGTKGNDILCGRGGDDVVFGLGGDDCIVAGSGRDWVFASEGQDWIDGGFDADRLAPGGDWDRVLGGGGGDIAACDRGDACSGVE